MEVEGVMVYMFIISGARLPVPQVSVTKRTRIPEAFLSAELTHFSPEYPSFELESQVDVVLLNPCANDGKQYDCLLGKAQDECGEQSVDAVGAGQVHEGSR